MHNISQLCTPRDASPLALGESDGALVAEPYCVVDFSFPLLIPCSEIEDDFGPWEVAAFKRHGR